MNIIKKLVYECKLKMGWRICPYCKGFYKMKFKKISVMFEVYRIFCPECKSYIDIYRKSSKKIGI